MSVQSYRDLQVWQKAMDLVAACYQLTTRLPQTETMAWSPTFNGKLDKFHLTSRMGTDGDRRLSTLRVFRWPTVR